MRPPHPHALRLLQPLQQRGQDPSLGQASPRPSGAGSPYMDLGAVTKRCLATSLATVDGALPISLAISRQGLPRSSILSMEFLSCLVSLEYALPGPVPAIFLPIAISNLPGPADSGPARRLKGIGGWSKTQGYAFRWVWDAYR